MNKYRLKHGGSMVVEFGLGLGIWGVAMVGLLAVGRVAVQRQRALRVARYGAFLQSTARVTDAVVRAELEDYARALAGGDAAAWRIESGRFTETASSRFYRLVHTRVTAPVRGFDAPVIESVVVQQEAAP